MKTNRLYWCQPNATALAKVYSSIERTRIDMRWLLHAGLGTLIMASILEVIGCVRVEDAKKNILVLFSLLEGKLSGVYERVDFAELGRGTC